MQRWRQRRGALGTQRDAAVAVGALTALGYALLAGWSVPTQRTVIMIALAAAALRLRRRVGAADALALGALAVLVSDPLAPLAVGFWLSFVAVAVILFVSTGHVREPGVLAGFTRVQMAVTIGLVPVLAGAFGSVSLVSAAVNAAAIPLYTLVIVPAILTGTAVTLVAPDAGAAVLGAVASLIEFTWPLIEAPAGWLHATWGTASLPVAGWIALVAGAVAALAPLPGPGRVAGVIMVVSLSAWRAPPPAPGAVHLALLDVGQGLSVVVQTRRHVLVYDTGPAFRSGTDTGLLVVEPYLRSRGVRTVDMLVASHDDDDHAGGAASVAQLLRVQERVASGRALDPLGGVQPCRAGQHWTWDGVRFDWLHPSEPLLPDDNDRSCVLAIRVGSRLIVLTGDVEKLAEQHILERWVSGPADIARRPASRQPHVVKRAVRCRKPAALGTGVGRPSQSLGIPGTGHRGAMAGLRGGRAANVELGRHRVRRHSRPATRSTLTMAARARAHLDGSLGKRWAGPHCERSIQCLSPSLERQTRAL